MIIVPLKEGENIERALKKFKRKFEKTGVVKELRDRQAFTKPSVRNRAQRIKAVYKQSFKRITYFGFDLSLWVMRLIPSWSI